MKTNIFEEISQVAHYLWERGWAEQNAGNISINVTGLVPDVDPSLTDQLPVESLPVKYPMLGGNLFIITPAGSRMRELTKNTIEKLCFIRINANGDGYNNLPVSFSDSLFPVKSFPGSPGDNLAGSFPSPSSELPAHLSIHEMLVQEKPENKAVIHTHATELIALTQIPAFQSSESINRLLWGMHPETATFVPQGTGYVPYKLPGTQLIAIETVRELKNHQAVIWEKHGVFATGVTINQAFDTIDILAKSARIYFMVKQSGHEPEGLTDEQIKELKG